MAVRIPDEEELLAGADKEMLRAALRQMIAERGGGGELRRPPVPASERLGPDPNLPRPTAASRAAGEQAALANLAAARMRARRIGPERAAAALPNGAALPDPDAIKKLLEHRRLAPKEREGLKEYARGGVVPGGKLSKSRSRAKAKAAGRGTSTRGKAKATAPRGGTARPAARRSPTTRGTSTPARRSSGGGRGRR